MSVRRDEYFCINSFNFVPTKTQEAIHCFRHDRCDILDSIGCVNEVTDGANKCNACYEESFLLSICQYMTHAQCYSMDYSCEFIRVCSIRQSSFLDSTFTVILW